MNQLIENFIHIDSKLILLELSCDPKTVFLGDLFSHHLFLMMIVYFYYLLENSNQYLCLIVLVFLSLESFFENSKN